MHHFLSCIFHFRFFSLASAPFNGRSHTRCHKRRNEGKKIARLFCLLFFIVSSLLASKMLVFLSFAQSYNARKKRRAQLKRSICLAENLWMCGLCYCGRLFITEIWNERKILQMREKKQRRNAKQQQRLSWAARNHLNDRFVAFWVNHTRV